ncbi:MAG: TraR/DksA family transcriptional regulator [Pseudomonadales bacterium]|nr:TraR/DksA family transcriptional regulator [Pseudomonadales bacterium]
MKQLEHFRHQLMKLREDLQAQYDLGESSGDTVVLDQSKVGRLSRMDAMQQQQMAKSNLVKTTNRLRRVNRALAKVESGDFGYCEECGENIAPARLQVQPEAPLCLACQSSSELSQGNAEGV